MEHDMYRDDRETVNLITQETRFHILQYILAHPENLPSLYELDYFIPKSKSTIHEHIDELTKAEIVGVYKLENSSRDCPSVFFGLTEYGIRLLDEVNMLQGKRALQTIYSNIDKSAEVERYENAPRPEKKEAPIGINSRQVHDQSDGHYDSDISNIVNDAIENIGTGIEVTDESDRDSGIVIIGCGGSGNNTINRFENLGAEDVKTVAINTDKQHLEAIQAEEKILIGESLTDGLGSSGNVDIAEKATWGSRQRIADTIQDAKLVFVTAGMGGGTGSGSVPIVSKIAKGCGATVVGVTGLPFDVERARQIKAQRGINKLNDIADTVIVLDNNRLLDYVPNLPIGKAFSVVDQIISETIKGLTDTITQPSLINLDYADVVSILKEGGISVITAGEADDKENTQEIVEDTLNHPLLDVDISTANSGLIHLTGGPDLSLKDAENVVSSIVEEMDTNANVIWGAQVKEEFTGQIRVMGILSNVDASDALPWLNQEKLPDSGSIQENKKYPTAFSRLVADS